MFWNVKSCPKDELDTILESYFQGYKFAFKTFDLDAKWESCEPLELWNL